MSAPTPDLGPPDSAVPDFMSFKADPFVPWTWADLVALPADLPWRCEIVDGALVMAPHARLRHEAVSQLLRLALQDAIGPRRMVLGPAAVDLHPTYRVPDLVVIDREILASDQENLHPRQAHLVIEVVSPGTATTDRVTKPAQYAAHGIGAYWRVETDGGVAITAFALREGAAVYTELGTWREGETLRVSEPFEISLDVAACVP